MLLLVTFNVFMFDIFITLFTFIAASHHMNNTFLGMAWALTFFFDFGYERFAIVPERNEYFNHGEDLISLRANMLL